MNTTDIINHDKQDYFPVFARYDIVLDHGDGPYLYDTNGKAYLDYLAGIAVNVVGHNYPPLVDAIATQAAKMIHCSNLYYTEVQAEAAAKLKALSGMDKVFFANSGAEANEGAIKLARKYATAKDPGQSTNHHRLTQFSRSYFGYLDRHRPRKISSRLRPVAGRF